MGTSTPIPLMGLDQKRSTTSDIRCSQFNPSVATVQSESLLSVAVSESAP